MLIVSLCVCCSCCCCHAQLRACFGMKTAETVVITQPRPQAMVMQPVMMQAQPMQMQPVVMQAQPAVALYA